MNLSAEQFHAIVNSIKPEPSTRAVEQRKDPRTTLDDTVEMAPYHYGVLAPRRSAVLCDISAGGIVVIFDIPLPMEGKFFVQLPSGDDRRPLVILCTTRHCCQIGHRFRIGGEFIACGEGQVEEVASRLPEAA